MIHEQSSKVVGARRRKASILTYCIGDGRWFSIPFQQVNKIIDVHHVYPCPFSEDWMEGMVVYEQSVLILLDSASYLQAHHPSLMAKKHQDKALESSPQGQKAIVCKVGGIEFAIKCENIRLLEGEITDPTIGSNQETIKQYKMRDGRILPFPDFHKFTNKMTGQFSADQEVIFTHELSEENVPETTEEEWVEEISMLKIKRKGKGFLVPFSAIYHIEQVGEFIESPQDLSDSIHHLSVKDDQVMPIVDSLATQQTQNLAEEEDNERYMVLQCFVDKSYFGVRIDSCKLVLVSKVLDEKEGSFGIVDEDTFPILDVNKIHQKIHRNYPLPTLREKTKVENKIFILFRIDDASCAIELKDAIEMMSADEVCSHEKIDFSESLQTENSFKGIVSTKNRNAIPVFDISQNLNVGIEKKVKDFSQVIIMGIDLEKSFGILATEIVGLVYRTEEHFKGIESHLKTLRGLLDLEDGKLAYVLNNKLH